MLNIEHSDLIEVIAGSSLENIQIPEELALAAYEFKLRCPMEQWSKLHPSTRRFISLLVLLLEASHQMDDRMEKIFQEYCLGRTKEDSIREEEESRVNSLLEELRKI
jgi:hypothetical protein